MAAGSSSSPILRERLPTPQEYGMFRDAAGWAPVDESHSAAGLQGLLCSRS